MNTFTRFYFVIMEFLLGLAMMVVFILGIKQSAYIVWLYLIPFAIAYTICVKFNNKAI